MSQPQQPPAGSSNTLSDGRQANTAAQSAWPWWVKWAQKTACVLAGLICAILGIFVCFTLNGLCLIAGILQIFFSCIVIMMEAPCCCVCIDFIDKIAKFSDSRPAWQKACLYCVLPITPVALCAEATTIISNSLVFVCGLSFFFLALGRKATREEMILSARSSQYTDGLVNNAAPMGQTPPPKPSQIV